MATLGDRNILNSILNPLLPLGECLDDGDGMEERPDCQDEAEGETPEIQEAKELENEGVKVAESGDVDKSIHIFTKSITIAPGRASGYNNRAQALRLKGNLRAAKEDLSNAINLSEGKGRVACCAFCQRGLIHQAEGRKEEAVQDYQSAAKLGSEFAKTMLVHLNPYAALCNQMLAEVMRKLQNGISLE